MELNVSDGKMYLVWSGSSNTNRSRPKVSDAFSQWSRDNEGKIVIHNLEVLTFHEEDGDTTHVINCIYSESLL